MVIVDCTTATGSRWVTTTVASGKVVSSGPMLLEVLGRLEHPALAGPVPLQDLQHRLHVGVVRGLVVAEVVVAPLRGPGHPLEVVGREVGQHQLELLVDVVGLHGVHGGHERGADLHRLPRLLASGPAGVDAVGPGLLPRVGHRLVGLPQRHRTEPGVRGQQVHQVGRARTGQPDDDHRLLDRDVQDLRMRGSAGRGSSAGWRRSGRSPRTSACARGRCVRGRRPSRRAARRGARGSRRARSRRARCARRPPRTPPRR